MKLTHQPVESVHRANRFCDGLRTWFTMLAICIEERLVYLSLIHI